MTKTLDLGLWPQNKTRQAWKCLMTDMTWSSKAKRGINRPAPPSGLWHAYQDAKPDTDETPTYAYAKSFDHWWRAPRPTLTPCSKHITSEQTAKLFFEHVWVHFGLPTSIVSNRDTRFVGKFWSSLWELMDTKLKKISLFPKFPPIFVVLPISTLGETDYRRYI